MIRTPSRLTLLTACAAVLFSCSAAYGGWPVATLVDFDPNPAAEFDDFINPLAPDLKPVLLSAQNGIGTANSGGVQITPPPSSLAFEFSAYSLATGSLAGPGDSLQQSIDFKFTDENSSGVAGIGLMRVSDQSHLLIGGLAGGGNGDILIGGVNNEEIQFIATATPDSILNWFRLDSTFTASGDAVTVIGGLYDLGPDGTDIPLLVFPINAIFTNAEVATALDLSPAFLLASQNPTSDLTYADNFQLVPEPSTALAAAFGFTILVAFGWRRKVRPREITASEVRFSV